MINRHDPYMSGESIPEFFTPARTKLFGKILQERANLHRYSRKPIPLEKKKEMETKFKDFTQYKLHELQYENDYELVVKKNQNDNIAPSILLLPDYLVQECLNDDDRKYLESFTEYRSDFLYVE